ELTGPEGIYVAGVGQHQMWAAQFIRFERPNSWLNSGGAGTMGYSVPAAMGAKVAEPDRVVWSIDGDGCFQMTNQELAPARSTTSRSRSPSSTTLRSAWCASGRRCSTTGATRT